MKPGLEEVLDYVMTGPHLYLRFDLTRAGHDQMQQAYDKVKRGIQERPDEYLRIEKPWNGSLRDRQLWQEFADIYFDVIQRKYFPDEQVYRADDFLVSAKQREDPVPITGTVRETVRTFRNAGFKVRWPNEKSILAYASAARKIHHEVSHEATRLQQQYDWECDQSRGHQ